MVITLIGYRGTGKSTVAAPLASRLGWSWVDADEDIETWIGRSIREIFAQEGEEAFRKYERETMQRLLDWDRGIIAAGGGAILNEQTRQDIQNAGPVVWLTASPQTIVSRMEDDDTTAERRPNLTTCGGKQEVERLLNEREPLYRECADVIVDTEGKDVDALVNEIMAAVEPLLQEGAGE